MAPTFFQARATLLWGLLHILNVSAALRLPLLEKAENKHFNMLGKWGSLKSD